MRTFSLAGLLLVGFFVSGLGHSSLFAEQFIPRSDILFLENSFSNVSREDAIADTEITHSSDPQVLQANEQQVAGREQEHNKQAEALERRKNAAQLPLLSDKDLVSPGRSTGSFVAYRNERVDAFIHMYTKKKRTLFKRGLNRSGLYLGYIKKVFAEKGIPENLAYLAFVESNMNTRAVSRVGATGLWQFMAPTGREYGLVVNSWQDDRLDPVASTHAAAAYLKDLYREFGDWEHALAAYNSGPGRVRSAIRRNKKAGKPTDFWSLRLPRETRGYVPAMMSVTIIMKDLGKYSFSAPETYPIPPLFDHRIPVPGSVSLEQIANKFKIDKALLVRLNPSLRRGITPVSTRKYRLRVPQNTKVTPAQINALKREQSSTLRYHKVRRGDTLWRIASLYRVSLSDLRKKNAKLANSPRSLRPGARVVIPAQYRANTSAKITGGGVYHKVRKGESLWSISRAYGVNVNQLKRLNQHILKQGSVRLLKPGQQVLIKKDE